MSADSIYVTTCSACGAEIRTVAKEGRCGGCGREFEIVWPAGAARTSDPTMKTMTDKEKRP